MTTPSHRASDAPRKPLYASESDEAPFVGTERGPHPEFVAQTGAQSLGPVQPRLTAFDNPNWHRHQAAGHWTPPPACTHRPDPVFGPCSCRDHDQP